MRHPLLLVILLVVAACSADPTELVTTSEVVTTVTYPTTTTRAPGPTSTSTTLDQSPEREGLQLTIGAERAQTMRGWGVSIVFEREGLEPLASGEMTDEMRDRAWDLLISDAGVNLIRIFSPGFGGDSSFESENDNADPSEIDVDAMGIVPSERLAIMEEIADRGVRFLLTGGAAPSWMKEGLQLRSDMAPEFAEHLTAYALFARETTGVEFDWVTVANEPDNSSMRLQVGPKLSADVLAALAELLPTYGLRARLVVGDTVGWATAGDYLSAAIQEPVVIPVLDSLAVHSYGGLESRSAVAEQAEADGLEVWMTEMSAAGGKDCTGDDPGMGSAFEWAEWISQDLVEGKASVWLAFRGVAELCHDPQGGLLVYDTTNAELSVPLRYYAFRNYALAGPPNSTLIPVQTVGEVAFSVVAFDRGEDVAIVVANPDHVSLPVEIVVPWEDATVKDVRITTEKGGDVAGRIPDMLGGETQLDLPARSIVTIVIRP